ncbi:MULTISPECIES: hypothetical protein [Parafrankia]|uniref:hypothetical protein n=1 Tax=Parafrankia TaxID=2994362 RepID=UPI000AE48497|nr:MULTISPECIES: hypothetical protein [Parafrankia]
MPHGPGQVLVTSRNRRWQSIVDMIEVDVFDRRESLEFLDRRVPDLGEPTRTTSPRRWGTCRWRWSRPGAL